MSFEEDDLESGLKIIGEVNPSSRSCAIGFFVRTGSRDENPGESGLSHFLEHMVFKGSETRDSTKVNKELDLIGASSMPLPAKKIRFTMDPYFLNTSLG